MTEYLTLCCDSIEGKQVRAVLELTEPVDYRSTMIGRISVFIANNSYKGGLGRQSLNREVVWDEKYLQSLRAIFRLTHKQFTLSAIEKDQYCSLELKSEITKGIKIVLLSTLLTKQKEDTFRSINDLFTRLATDKQRQRDSLQSELKRLHNLDEIIDRQESQLQRNFSQGELDIKTNFLRQINDVKLKIRRKWPDLNRKSLHDLHDPEAPMIVISQPPRDELLDIFK